MNDCYENWRAVPIGHLALTCGFAEKKAGIAGRSGIAGENGLPVIPSMKRPPLSRAFDIGLPKIDRVVIDADSLG